MAITLLGNSIETPHLLVKEGSDTGGSVSSSPNLNDITTSCTRQINVSNDCSSTDDYSQVNASLLSTASDIYSQVNASRESVAGNWNSQVNASRRCEANGSYSQINCSSSVLNVTPHSTAWGYNDNIHAAPAEENQTIRLESQGGHAFFKGKVRIGEDSIASPSNQDYGLVVVGGSDTGGSVSSPSDLNDITTSCTKQINVSNDCSLLGDYSQVNASENSSVRSLFSQINASRDSIVNLGNLYSQINASGNCEISAWRRRSQINSSRYCKLSAIYSQINCSHGVENETSYSTAWGYGEGTTSSVNNQTIRLESVGGHAFFKGKVRIGEDSIVSPSSQSQPLKINGGICQKYAVGDDNIFYNKLDPSDIFSPTNDFINGVNIRRVVRIRDVRDTNFQKSIMRSIPKNKTMTISISVSMVRVLSSDSGQTDTDDYYEGVFIYSSYFDGVDHGFKTKTVVKTPSSLSSVSFVVYSIGYDYNEIDMEFSGVTAGVTLDYMAVVDITISGRTQV